MVSVKALQLHVSGVVQGVGFRPFVYRLARELSLQGWVLNASDGVHICVEGVDALVDSFPQLLETRLESDAPAASVEKVTVRSVPVSNFEEFEIRPSVVDVTERTFISPDVATCQACVSELFDPDNRRYRYPFTNCTDCGPRFTIIEDTPYDRPKTTMRDFPLCEDCAAEYADPADRRFHAQPDACFVCGPRLYFNRANIEEDASRNQWAWSPELEETPRKRRPSEKLEDERARSNSILIEAAETLTQGRIVAIKGLGGFQLACNAQSEIAVRRLRERKHRWGKPLAVMFANIEQATRYVELDVDERALLEGSVRPIVLCKRREVPDGAPELALSVAPGLREVGVMLPYTPLHHLLLEEFYGPLVMTSGNLSGSPIVTDNATALAELGSVADAFLLHDRPISGRYDDSVVRIVDGRVQMVRRARGFAPAPLKLRISMSSGTTSSDTGLSPLTSENVPDSSTYEASRTQNITKMDALPQLPSVLSAGSEQKNTFTLAGGEPADEPAYAFVSQHIGDLENSATLAAFEETESHYEQLFKISPAIIAHDLHPEYLATKWARIQEEKTATSAHPLRLIGVQHHHAHIVAAAAEHGVSEPVIGLAFDGTGYGSDGSIWGGEVLIAAASEPDFERFAHLRTFALPGGAGAIKRPIRTLYALLEAYGLRDHPAVASVARRLEPHEGATVLAMVEKELNTPLTSSMGRLFDAVASLLGVADEAVFEGSPAMMLEAVSSPLDSKPTPPRYRFHISETAPAAKVAESVQFSAFGGELDGPARRSFVIDPEPVIRALLDDLEDMEDPESELTTAELSRRFHDAVVAMIGSICTKAARERGLNTVALGGGVFMNRLILSGTRRILEAKGLRVLVGEQLPVNDGAISYGQAVVARAVLAAEASEEFTE